jgi:hypothetical protein
VPASSSHTPTLSPDIHLDLTQIPQKTLKGVVHITFACRSPTEGRKVVLDAVAFAELAVSSASAQRDVRGQEGVFHVDGADCARDHVHAFYPETASEHFQMMPSYPPPPSSPAGRQLGRELLPVVPLRREEGASRVGQSVARGGAATDSSALHCRRPRGRCEGGVGKKERKGGGRRGGQRVKQTWRKGKTRSVGHS